MTDNFQIFRGLLVDWLENTHLFPGQNLHIDLILNPHAGAFRQRHRLTTLLEQLREAKASLPIRGRPQRLLRVASWSTEYPGHERVILANLRTDPQDPWDQRLIVTAGGDGTSRGILISALALDSPTREHLVFFRLPLGTGNDAAETRDWIAALAVLSGQGAEFAVRSLPVIEVKMVDLPVHYSFNVASVGLDAFVVHLTNTLKRWFPGNSYSLMVDVATLFYESFVQVVPTTLELFLGKKKTFWWDEGFLLAALGTTGHRTYGAGKRILPDDDNFCMAATKTLFEKLALRKPFYDGTQRGLPGINLASGTLLKVASPVRLPLQMDGEVLWLEPANFPLTMTIVDRGLRVLSLAVPTPLL